MISDVNIAWDLAKGWTVHQIPSSLPPLFSGDRLVVYAVLKASENANASDDNKVRLEGMFGNEEKVQHLVKFSTPPTAVEPNGNVVLHQLAAKSFIQDKQDGVSERNDGQEVPKAKRSIISISKSANVVSKFTSFVAVDKDSNQPVSGPLQKHFVPSYQSGYAGNFLNMKSYYCTPLSASVASCDYMEMTVGSCDYMGMTKSSVKKKKSKGLNPNLNLKFSSLFGSAARPPAPAAVFGSAAPPPAPAAVVKHSLDPAPRTKSKSKSKSMPQETKEASAGLWVISLQKASGSWDLTDQLVSLSGTSRDALIKGCPKEIAVDTGEGKLLWATALALVLLMGKFLDQKDEWEMIAEKGSKWMKKNLPAGVKYENVLAAAATTVGVQVRLGQ